MASYGNDLRLKEITTGDETGTWGTSTNTNLTLIADAFGYGTKQLSADADQTFTMPDATADATRALYLKFTSAVSLTATRTVTLGPNTISKVWLIENATSGSQSIIIKQGSGATVTVASGTKVFLYSDGAGAGAAVVNANPTSATAGTVTSVDVSGGTTGLTTSGGAITGSGTITLGGTLAASNGGTGLTALGAGVATFLGTPSSANLAAAVTGETGTGALVFGTGPTLYDPIISGTVLEDVYTITDGAAFEVDPGNGSIQLITLTASRTPKATNFAAGESVTMMVDDGTAYTITWTDATWGGSGVVWKTNAGTAPALNLTGYTAIELWKVGTQVYGARVGDN
jgi:hypothetical protein